MLGYMAEKVTLVDFVARGITPNEWRIVLVEEGPWRDGIEGQLRRVQNRLYDCIDLALDGQLANKYPESRGSNVIIQVDFYNIEDSAVGGFLTRFKSGVFSSGDYKDATKNNSFVKNIDFEFNFDSVH